MKIAIAIMGITGGIIVLFYTSILLSDNSL